MRIYIIRHGETAANKAGMFQGWTDVPLNENGMELAKRTGRALTGIHFDFCVSSPLIRAQQTARLVLRESGNENAEILLDHRIKEIHMGDWEGRRFGAEAEDAERERLFFEDVFAFGHFPAGESARDVCDRTQSFLKELISRNDDSTCLVATHGFALRAMLHELYPDPSDFWQGRVPANCSVSILEACNGQGRLLEMDRTYYEKNPVS